MQDPAQNSPLPVTNKLKHCSRCQKGNILHESPFTMEYIAAIKQRPDLTPSLDREHVAEDITQPLVMTRSTLEKQDHHLEKFFRRHVTSL